MMKKLIVLLTALTVMVFCPVVMAIEYISIDDGLSHTIDDYAFFDDVIEVDSIIANEPGTHVNLIDGGRVRAILAYNYAITNMSGGFVSGALYAHDNASITMSGGEVHAIKAWGNSSVTITGGEIQSSLTAYDNSSVTILGVRIDDIKVFYDSTLSMSSGAVLGDIMVRHNGTLTMSGGSVRQDLEVWDNSTATVSGGLFRRCLLAYEDGMIYLNGTDFKVDGQNLSYGDNLSDFVTPREVTFGDEAYIGNITGTLADGTALDAIFRIYHSGRYAGNADIVIVPEPCSLLLLGLGGLVLRRRR